MFLISCWVRVEPPPPPALENSLRTAFRVVRQSTPLCSQKRWSSMADLGGFHIGRECR